LSAPLVAQNSCVIVVGAGTIAYPGFFDCASILGAGATCHIVTSHCAPPNAAQETAPGARCLACEAAAAGHPINLANGNVYIPDGDLSVPGLGGGLALGRSWNGILPASQSTFNTGIFGLHWRSNYEERVFLGSDNYIKYQRGDGSFWSFGYDSAGTYLAAAPSNDASKLTFDDTNHLWTLTFQSGAKRTFDYNSGSLLTIVDRNGNTTTLTRDGTNRITTVTDPAGRHLYFTYGTSGDALYLVQSVTSGAIGISLSYTYDASNRLTQVTKPDGTTITYAYNSQNLITSVSDSTGVIESHTYDSQGRGLTSSRANGVQAVTASTLRSEGVASNAACRSA